MQVETKNVVIENKGYETVNMFRSVIEKKKSDRTALNPNDSNIKELKTQLTKLKETVRKFDNDESSVMLGKKRYYFTDYGFGSFGFFDLDVNSDISEGKKNEIELHQTVDIDEDA